MRQEQFISFTPTEFPFDILTSGITTGDYHHIVERVNCPYYILEYLCTGSGTFICNGKQYHANAGDVIIMPKGSNHRYYADEQWTKIWFNVDGALVTNLLHTYNLENFIIFRDINNQKLFDDFYNLTSSSEPIEDIIFASAIKFHAIIQHLFLSRKETRLNTAYEIKKLIDNDLYQGKISIKDIAKQLFISQTKLIEVFKNNYHATPYQYFTNKRLSIAASLLLSSNYSINEIAEMLNYADTASFSNAFKKNMGMSPKAYRTTNTNKLTHITNFIDETDDTADEK